MEMPEPFRINYFCKDKTFNLICQTKIDALKHIFSKKS